jgi:hypothetical protein
MFRGFSPFGVMKDVRRGTHGERLAAHRYNRRMRDALSACMLRWAVSCMVALLLTSCFDVLGAGSGPFNLFALLSAACATFVACGICVLFVSAYVYAYLAHDDP